MIDAHGRVWAGPRSAARVRQTQMPGVVQGSDALDKRTSLPRNDVDPCDLA